MARTPQQNGRAERLNRTLPEIGRAMLAASDVQRRYWPETLKYANDVRNVSPYRVAARVPLHAFKGGDAPYVSRLRVFGSEVSVLLPTAQRGHKLDAVAVRARFVGLEPGTKGWRVLLPSRKVSVECNVVWHGGELGEMQRLPAEPAPGGDSGDAGTQQGAAQQQEPPAVPFMYNQTPASGRGGGARGRGGTAARAAYGAVRTANAAASPLAAHTAAAAAAAAAVGNEGRVTAGYRGDGGAVDRRGYRCTRCRYTWRSTWCVARGAAASATA